MNKTLLNSKQCDKSRFKKDRNHDNELEIGKEY